jgi:hypothetical protein
MRGSGAVVVNIRVRRKERGFVHVTFMGLVAARVRTALARAVVHGVARARGACATRVVVLVLLLVLQLPALLDPEMHALLMCVLLLLVL